MTKPESNVIWLFPSYAEQLLTTAVSIPIPPIEAANISPDEDEGDFSGMLSLY